MRTRSLLIVVAIAFAVLVQAGCAAPAPKEEDVIGVLESFYGAMKTGDTAAAMRPIAADAVFIESGRIETREQYETSHLPADIEFEKQVNGKRLPWQVKFKGDTAWAIATTEFDGTFNGTPLSFTSTQLAVLTREDAGWQIRSIHWSSPPRR
jgi:ketosteroid isomerase-like protein